MPPEPEPAATHRHRLERAAVVALAALASRLPDAAAGWLANRVAAALRMALPFRRKLTEEQIAAALGLPAGSREARELTRAAFRHFMRLPLELLALPQLVERGRLEEVVPLLGRAHLDAALAGGRGAILVTGHFGNWEAFGLVASRYGYSLTSVARPLKNPLLDRDITALRGRFGHRVVAKEGAGLPLARVLRAGGLVGLITDQYAGSRGVRVPFFHADASTFTMAAVLARRFGAPLVPMFSRVAGNHRIETRFEPPLEVDPALPEDEDAYRLMLAFNRRLEVAIRADPGQYLWLHRRWKKGGQEPDPRWRQRYAPPR